MMLHVARCVSAEQTQGEDGPVRPVLRTPGTASLHSIRPTTCSPPRAVPANRLSAIGNRPNLQYRWAGMIPFVTGDFDCPNSLLDWPPQRCQKAVEGFRHHA